MNEFGNLVAGQIVAAGLVALGLPFGLLLLASRPAWLDRTAAALDGRRTAAALWGAGVFLLALFALALLTKVRALQWTAVPLLVALVADFAAGFAAGAWAQGRALLRRESGASCLVAGWLARAGVFAVPVVGLAVGAYLVVLSLGTPVVAMLAARSGNATTDPSAGSTPAN